MPERGFQFQDNAARSSAFDKAKEFFARNPSASKLRRKDWPALLPVDTPQNSFIRIPPDGTILAIANGKDLGGLLGSGAFGRVKYAMDEHGGIYVLKIETANEIHQQDESRIAEDTGLMIGNKLNRLGGKYGNKEKYYSTLHYLGSSIKNRLQDTSKPLTLSEKITLARKIAWEVHKLHTGKLSKTGARYGHHDLKPDNIVIDEKGRVHLVDFGFAREMTQPTIDSGSPAYLPYFNRTSDTNDETLERAALHLTHTQSDTFSLKKTLYWDRAHGLSPKPHHCLFTESEYQQLPINVKQFICVNHDDPFGAMGQIKGPPEQTPLQMTALFLQIELKAFNPSIQLSTLTSAQQTDVCECWDYLEKIEENHSVPDPQIQTQIRLWKNQIAGSPGNVRLLKSRLAHLSTIEKASDFKDLLTKQNALFQQVESLQTMHDDLPLEVTARYLSETKEEIVESNLVELEALDISVQKTRACVQLIPFSTYCRLTEDEQNDLYECSQYLEQIEDKTSVLVTALIEQYKKQIERHPKDLSLLKERLKKLRDSKITGNLEDLISKKKALLTQLKLIPEKSFHKNDASLNIYIKETRLAINDADMMQLQALETTIQETGACVQHIPFAKFLQLPSDQKTYLFEWSQSLDKIATNNNNPVEPRVTAFIEECKAQMSVFLNSYRRKDISPLKKKLSDISSIATNAELDSFLKTQDRMYKQLTDLEKIRNRTEDALLTQYIIDKKLQIDNAEPKDILTIAEEIQEMHTCIQRISFTDFKKLDATQKANLSQCFECFDIIARTNNSISRESDRYIKNIEDQLKAAPNEAGRLKTHLKYLSSMTSWTQLRDFIKYQETLIQTLDSFHNKKIQPTDALLQQYITDTLQKIINADTQGLQDLDKDIKETLACIDSSEMQAVLKILARLDYEGSNTIFSDKFRSEDMIKNRQELCQVKAYDLRNALAQVPLTERKTVFSNTSHPQCIKVRTILAAHRKSQGEYRGETLQTTIDEKKAAKSFKELNKQFKHDYVRQKSQHTRASTSVEVTSTPPTPSPNNSQ